MHILCTVLVLYMCLNITLPAQDWPGNHQIYSVKNYQQKIK